MENTQVIAVQIKKAAKERKITVKQALIECGIGPNTVTKLSNGTDILTATLCKLADFFECSTDYLLGRNNLSELSQDEQLLLNAYSQLSEEQKNAIRNHAQSLAKLAQFEETQAVEKEEFERCQHQTQVDKQSDGNCSILFILTTAVFMMLLLLIR